MKLICKFEDFYFNTSEKFYQCIIQEQIIPDNEQFEFSGQHLPEKLDQDVTFFEFRDCNCPRVPQGLTKTFPNLKVLSIWNSKLKELTKDDMAEYKNLQRFICHKNEVDFLPGDLFEGFEDLVYLKFTGNKLGVIEPNLMDNLYKLQYRNFKSNPDIHQFSANWEYQFSANALHGMIAVTLYHNFLNADIKFIRNYVFKSADPKDRLDILKLYNARTYKSKLNILELQYDLHEADRAKYVEEIRNENDILAQKVEELESLNDGVADEVKELEEVELEMSKQMDECSSDLENVKKEGLKMKKNLQSQIDNLVHQFQSIICERNQNKDT